MPPLFSEAKTKDPKNRDVIKEAMTTFFSLMFFQLDNDENFIFVS